MVLMLAACGESHEKKLENARLWSASAIAVAGQWTREEVSSAYALQTLKQAADELRKGPVPLAAQPVDDLAEAVQREDRAAARRLLQDLSSAAPRGAE